MKKNLRYIFKSIKGFTFNIYIIFYACVHPFYYRFFGCCFASVFVEAPVFFVNQIVI